MRERRRRKNLNNWTRWGPKAIRSNRNRTLLRIRILKKIQSRQLLGNKQNRQRWPFLKLLFDGKITFSTRFWARKENPAPNVSFLRWEIHLELDQDHFRYRQMSPNIWQKIVCESLTASSSQHDCLRWPWNWDSTSARSVYLGLSIIIA